MSAPRGRRCREPRRPREACRLAPGTPRPSWPLREGAVWLARRGGLPSRDGGHDTPDPPIRDLRRREGAKEWTKSPLKCLGANHVLFGGMMAPASATAISCAIEIGYMAM